MTGAPATTSRFVLGDFAWDVDPAVWQPRLTGVDAVVNAVGILRQAPGQSFSALHIQTPRALFAACAEMGIDKVVQISALGADDGARSRYHVSKANADRYLMSLPLAWVILQPSLVFGEGGASARLFTTLASLPVVPLPGAGAQRVQPVHVDDVAALCVNALADASIARRVIPVVGPRAYSVRELSLEVRRRLGLVPTRALAVPEAVMHLAGRFAERVARIPLDTETLQMLARGNEASTEAMTAALGRAPRCALSFLSSPRSCHGLEPHRP